MSTPTTHRVNACRIPGTAAFHVVAIALLMALGACDQRTPNPPASNPGGTAMPSTPMPPASAASQ